MPCACTAEESGARRGSLMRADTIIAPAQQLLEDARVAREDGAPDGRNPIGGGHPEEVAAVGEVRALEQKADRGRVAPLDRLVHRRPPPDLLGIPPDGADAEREQAREETAAVLVDEEQAAHQPAVARGCREDLAEPANLTL